MKKNGFTVTEMITAGCIGLLFLVVAAVIYQKNIKNLPNNSTSKKVDPSVIDTDPTLETDQEEDYSALETSIKEAMKKYIEDTDYNEGEILLTQTVDYFVENKYIESLYDPANADNQCRGYGVYKVNTKEYQGYVRCPGSYATNGYNPEFE